MPLNHISFPLTPAGLRYNLHRLPSLHLHCQPSTVKASVCAECSECSGNRVAACRRDMDVCTRSDDEAENHCNKQAALQSSTRCSTAVHGNPFLSAPENLHKIELTAMPARWPLISTPIPSFIRKTNILPAVPHARSAGRKKKCLTTPH